MTCIENPIQPVPPTVALGEPFVQGRALHVVAFAEFMVPQSMISGSN